MGLWGTFVSAVLWVEARVMASETSLATLPPDLDEVMRDRDLPARVAAGEPFSMRGETIARPALAIGKVLAKDVDRREIPGTRHESPWVSADETRAGVDVTAAYAATTRQVHGWRDPAGRLHLYSSTSRHLLSSYVGDVGEEVLVVYDTEGPRHFVLKLKDDAGPVRTAFRGAAAAAPPPRPPVRVPSFPPFDPLRLVLITQGRPCSAPWELRVAAAPPEAPRESGTLFALYAAVAGALQEDGPRNVLADALIERGDVRGDFIAMQLRAARTTSIELSLRTRIDVLLREHWKRWAPAGTRDVRYHRGILQHAEWFAEADLHHPEWQTVESLHCSLQEPPRVSVLASARPALKSVSGLNAALLQQVLTSKPPGLLQLETWVPSQWLSSGLDDVLQALPTLRSLGLRWTEEVSDAQLRACLSQCAGLERLQLDGPGLTPARLAPLRELQRQDAPKLRVEVVLSPATEHAAVLELGRARVLSRNPVTDLYHRDALQTELGVLVQFVTVESWSRSPG